MKHWKDEDGYHWEFPMFHFVSSVENPNDNFLKYLIEQDEKQKEG